MFVTGQGDEALVTCLHAIFGQFLMSTVQRGGCCLSPHVLSGLKADTVLEEEGTDNITAGKKLLLNDKIVLNETAFFSVPASCHRRRLL